MNRFFGGEVQRFDGDAKKKNLKVYLIVSLKCSYGLTSLKLFSLDLFVKGFFVAKKRN